MARFQDGEKVTGDGGHVEKMRRLLKEVNDAGAGINSDNFATILIDSFPESWDPVISTLHGEKDIIKIVARLSAHGDRVAGRGSHPTNSTSTDLLNQALHASITALAQQIQSLNTTNRCEQRPSNGKSHEANENCKGIGHTIEECWKIGGGKQGQYPPWWKGKCDAPLRSSYANLAQSMVTVDPVTGVSTSVFALHASGGTGNSMEKDGVTLKVNQTLIAKGTGGLDSSKLFSDLCATMHFIKQRVAFSNYIPLKDYAGGSSKAGVNLNIAGIGTVAFEMDKRNIIMLEKALHCPDILANLVSVSCLDKDGWSVMYRKGRVSFVAPDGEEIFTGELSGDLYTINGTLLHAEKHQALTARSMDVAVPMEIWHMCFVHHGINRIKALVHGNLVDGINVKAGPDLPGKCEPCIIGNQKRRLFNAIVKPETELLALVALDIWGPARVRSIGGVRYAMEFTDDSSSHHQAYFLPDRNATMTLSALDSFTTMAERQTGKKLKKIHCDNEFDCKLWCDWAEKQGIILLFMAPYSSAANGVAECAFGVVFGTVRIMLIEAGMSHGWWAEACDYTIKVGNLLPSM